MQYPIPIGNFRWLTQEEINALNFSTMTDFQLTGYFVQCDISYPEKLHQSHNSLPLCQDFKTITEKDLSPHAKKIFKDLIGENLQYKSRKLVGSFEEKINYVTHYSNLQFYIQQGLIVNNVSKVLAFDQSPYLTQYMDFCTEQHRLATNTFDRKLMKSLIDSCFSKTVENVQEYFLCNFASSVEMAEQLNTNQFFNQFFQVTANLSVHISGLDNVVMNNLFPIGKKHMKNSITKNFNPMFFSGFSILERSKLIVYKTFYEKFRPTLDDVEVCLTDIDSFLCTIKTPQSYEEMIQSLNFTFWDDLSMGKYIEEMVGVCSRGKFRNLNKVFYMYYLSTYVF